ncbi:unnamed protein product [Mytilus edulis]|uniref:Fibrinogen C-terminal domain-containing protein n=1 Tax=Mytilus edulis TaxID=6550 RepID=A0A8S3T9Y3_MYTED|nr:unnamed protein product [Mytilus edulis]
MDYNASNNLPTSYPYMNNYNHQQSYHTTFQQNPQNQLPNHVPNQPTVRCTLNCKCCSKFLLTGKACSCHQDKVSIGTQTDSLQANFQKEDYFKPKTSAYQFLQTYGDRCTAHGVRRKRCTYTHKKDTHEHKKTNEHKRIEKRVKTSKNRRIETSEYTNKCVRIKTSKHGYIKTDERANKHKRIAIGNKYLNLLTTNGKYELRVDLTGTNNKMKYALYKTFTVSDENSQYKLSIGGYSGTAGDMMVYNNGNKFSTKDRDHDTWNERNCAKSRGGWWHRDCGIVFLNIEMTKNKLYWNGFYYIKSTMMIRPIM